MKLKDFLVYILITINFALGPSAVLAQTQYSLQYDFFDKSSERILSATEYENRIFVAMSSVVAGDTEQGCIVAELNEDGSFKWMHRFPEFETLWKNALLISNDTIYLGGWRRTFDDAFIQKLTSNGEELDRISLKAIDVDADQIHPWGIAEQLFNNQIILYGDVGYLNNDTLFVHPAITSINLDGSIDTTLIFGDGAGGIISDVIVDYKRNQLHLLEDVREWYDNGVGIIVSKKIRIHSLDTIYEMASEWNSDLLSNSDNTRIDIDLFQNGDFLITGRKQNWISRELWRINGAGEIILLYDFRDAMNRISVQTIDIEVVNYDNILVTGFIPRRTDIIGEKAYQLPYLGLFSSDGNRIWERIFEYTPDIERLLHGSFWVTKQLMDNSIFVAGECLQDYVNDQGDTLTHQDIWLARLGEDGCIEDDCMYVTVDLKELPIVDEKTINIFPNPTADLLNIDLPVSINIDRIQIFDAVGNLVFFELGKDNREIDCSELTTGIYYLNVSTAEGSYAAKFVRL